MRCSTKPNPPDTDDPDTDEYTLWSFNLLKRLHYESVSICEDVLAEQLLRVGTKPSSDLQADKKHKRLHTNNEAMHGVHYGTV